MTAPRVDFYVLASDDPAARLRFACRLVEKAWLKNHRVRVQFDPGGELDAFDELLWTFADRSFVPHEMLLTAGAAPEAPVLLSSGVVPEGRLDVLINLAGEVPACLAQAERVADIIDGDDGRRRAGRARFRAYRERGLEPTTHAVKIG